jgi:transcription initiation factor IIE alpha subunit
MAGKIVKKIWEFIVQHTQVSQTIYCWVIQAKIITHQIKRRKLKSLKKLTQGGDSADASQRCGRCKTQMDDAQVKAHCSDQ